MAERFNAQVRLTYKYNDAWAELDHYEFPDFTVKVVRGRFDQGTDFDDTQTTAIEITASRPATRKEITDTLRAQYRQLCRCEHDCCGHLNGGPSRIQQASKNGRRWTAILAYTPNY